MLIARNSKRFGGRLLVRLKRSWPHAGLRPTFLSVAQPGISPPALGVSTPVAEHEQRISQWPGAIHRMNSNDRTTPMKSKLAVDYELKAVASAIRGLDPKGLRAAQVLRYTLDQLYDGQRTGRYRWDQLYTTESKHVGEIIEMNLHREFEFPDGASLDYRIAGVDVDCKYSQHLGGWMIPPEAQGHLCLVVWADDNTHNGAWA